jgi:hypothetical protein
MKSIGQKKKIFLVALVVAFSGAAYSCIKTKQCCKRDYKGNLSCITKCDYQYCPYNYPIEIK